jgi:peptidoglycan-associated lipoprotein
MRQLCLVVLVTTFAAGSTACASKKFVRSSVGTTNDKVNEMIASLEETQSQTARHERRIADVDKKTGSASEAARAAYGVASGAAGHARKAGSRLDAIDKASRRLVYDVSLSANEGNFQFGHAELPADARIRIDKMIHQLVEDPQNVFIEIEGHTDSVGSNTINSKVGLSRARAVQRYLYEVHQIPLHRMSIISFGEEKPAASNTTETGRAQNRRVVIRIRA